MIFQRQPRREEVRVQPQTKMAEVREEEEFFSIFWEVVARTYIFENIFRHRKIKPLN